MATKFGLSESNLKNWIRGTEPKVEALASLAKALGVDLNWLVYGSSELQRPSASDQVGDYLAIPRYSAQLSAGNGTFVERSEILNHIPFNADFFDKHLKRAPDDMIIVDARGESMEPTMRDRDLLMIDRSSANRPVTSAIYGFTFGQDVYVKRLFVTPNGIVAKSDNKDYGEFTIRPEDIEQFHPIGRVVWIGRTL